MDMIKSILERPEFAERPPVLLDIGAATHLHAKWKKIAKYSICIAFDPDARSMDYISEESSCFKKLHIFPAIVHPEIDGDTDFFLTASPECSSLLKPLTDALDHWFFADFYKFDQQTKLPSVTLKAVLKQLTLDYIDWFKIDSQGTDLRIFKSLGDDMINKILIAELEPGIMDTYDGEDKIFSVLDFMDKRNFWLSDFEIFGSQYLPRKFRENNFSPLERKVLPSIMKAAPGWTEICFLNKLKDSGFDKRDYMLEYVMAVIEDQYGFALEIADRGKELFDDKIFDEMFNYALKHIKRRCYFSGALFKKIIKKLSGK